MKRLLLLPLLLGLALCFAFMGSAPAHADSNAFVRVVHAAPAAPTVDVYVDGSKLLPNFVFGTVTDYVPLAAGAHTIAVVAAGQDISKAVITGSATVTAGQYYTIAAIGNSSPAVKPSLVVFADDNTVKTGFAKVRVYHLSDNAGPVAVAAAPGGQSVIPNLTFQNASDYLSVAPGNYNFEVTLLSANNTKVQQAATLVLHKITSVFALGEVGGSGTTVFKFAAATVASVPSGLPNTGVAPQQSTSGMPMWALVAGIVLMLGGVGSAGLAISRRRA